MMCNLHWCYTFCTGVTLFALVLHLNSTALSQSESSNFFMYIINLEIQRQTNMLTSDPLCPSRNGLFVNDISDHLPIFSLVLNYHSTGDKDKYA